MRQRWALAAPLGVLLIALAANVRPNSARAAVATQFGDVTVVSSSLCMRENRDVNIVGEVVNNTNSTVTLVKVTVTFLSDENAARHTNFGFALMQEIAPGGTSPFSVRSLTALPGVTHYHLRVTYEPAQPSLLHDFEVRVGGIYQNGIGGVDIVGEVRNSGGADASTVQVFIAPYDAQGVVIRLANTTAERMILPAGAVVSWFASETTAPPAYAGYRAWAEALAG